jgi:hypothetical protein
MVANYEVMFGMKTSEYSSPMIAKDHPELDHTPELDECGIKQYQSLISALHWLVTLGWFDILITVTTMSGYYIAPREGNLECRMQNIGYAKKHPDGAISFCTNIPDHEAHNTPKNAQLEFFHLWQCPRGYAPICLSLKVKYCVQRPTKI